MGLPATAEPAAPSLTEGEFRRLYDAHFTYVWHTLRRLGVPEADLEDLAHEVFVAFFRGYASYDPERPLKPWLFGIAFRIASDDRQRARRRHEVPAAEDEAPDPTPGAERRLQAEEDRRLVLAALADLPLDRRAVLIMHDIEGRSMPEIAQVIDAPLNTLYSRLRLGREQFEAAVRRRMGRKP